MVVTNSLQVGFYTHEYVRYNVSHQLIFTWCLLQGNAGFMHAFIATLSVIVVSELGDKTFFISAIMAMRHSRIVVFAGAMAALSLMHVMSGKSPFIY